MGRKLGYPFSHSKILQKISIRSLRRDSVLKSTFVELHKKQHIILITENRLFAIKDKRSIFVVRRFSIQDVRLSSKDVLIMTYTNLNTQKFALIDFFGLR
jgi:hypothetical protein